MLKEKGNTLIGIVVGIVLVIIIGGAYYLGTQKNNVPVQVPTAGNPIVSSTPASSDPNPDWKTYTSTFEKASFKYPSDWKVIKPTMESNVPNADTLTLQSPGGELKVEWISAIDGLGGGCNTEEALGIGDACPLLTVFDKSPIPGAAGMYVISGTKTSDNKTFTPWLAVQDGNGLLATKRLLFYPLYQSKITLENVGLYVGVWTVKDADLSQADAMSFFDKPEVKQAKSILLSLTY